MESRDAARARIAALLEPMEVGPHKGPGFRGKTKLEAMYVNLAAVQETYRVGERDLMTELRAARTAIAITSPWSKRVPMTAITPNTAIPPRELF